MLRLIRHCACFAIACRCSLAAPAAAQQSSSGGAVFTPPPPPPEQAAIVDGRAVAPASAPPRVQAVIAAANEIVEKPYVYGGGHRPFASRLARGYDCSGAVSHALYGGRFLRSPLDSSSFMRWGRKGVGELDHGLHGTVACVRRDRRAALRHEHAGSRRPGPGHRPALEHAAAHVLQLRRAPPARLLNAFEPLTAARKRLGTRDLNPNFHIQSVACCRYTSPQRRPSV